MISRRIAFGSIALVVVTVVAYFPLWRNDFVNFDDDIYLTENRDLGQGLTGKAIRWAWTNEKAPYWQPVTWLSFLLDAQFFPLRSDEGEPILSPVAVHGQNLFWHTLNAVLLFLLLGRLTGQYWRSYFVAALFALHPMQVESVAWAIERKDVLSTFFGLVALWAYVRYTSRPSRMNYSFILVAYAISLLSKPMLITLPFVLLAMDYWPLRRFGPGASPPSLPFSFLVREKLPLFLLATLCAATTIHARESHGAIVSLDTLSLSARMANVLASYGWYLSATFWPTDLAALYPHPYEHWSGLRVFAGSCSLLLITGLCYWQRGRQPWLIVGWLWFVVCLFPMTGLAQGGGQAWADRFAYWPHIGLFVAVVWGGANLVERLRIPSPVGGVAAVLVLVGLGALTWVQVGYWRTSRTLWEHTLAVTADNDRAHQYLSMDHRKRGRREEAAIHQAAAYRIVRKRLLHDRQ